MFPCVSMHLIPQLPKSKKVPFTFTQNQADTRLFKSWVGSFMYTVGMAGLSVKDHVTAYDPDAGIKPPETENREFMDPAYRRGRDLL